LIIHGGGDTYIKPEMARALFDRVPDPKEFWLVDGAKHNQAQQLAANEYRQRVLDFFNRHLATPLEKDVLLNGTAGPEQAFLESRTDSPVVPLKPSSPAAPAAGEQATGTGNWGSGTQLPCS
jgi:PhoPQ-activated pathogenicity-related protein